jgi:hypothetical protein
MLYRIYKINYKMCFQEKCFIKSYKNKGLLMAKKYVKRFLQNAFPLNL